MISGNRTEHGIPHTVSCRALGVSEPWFCKWRERRPTARELRRQRLADEITEIFSESGGTYGSPKIFVLLIRRGWRVSVNTVAKLMAELGLVARVVRRRRGLTRPGKRAAAPDFVKRDFTAEAPDLVRCGGMTEIVTEEGKLYLATVIDLFSRRLLGYAMGERHDAGLVIAALHMAAATRGGDVRGVIFHSDRGSEYGSRKFTRACRRLGITRSMGRAGPCFDSAVSEAFNSVLKVEYVHRHTFRTRAEARIRIATWITGFYNTLRLHSVCDFKIPIDCEREYWAGLTVGLAAWEGLHDPRGLTIWLSSGLPGGLRTGCTVRSPRNGGIDTQEPQGAGQRVPRRQRASRIESLCRSSNSPCLPLAPSAREASGADSGSRGHGAGDGAACAG
ncbi:IS3 family transposase [Streptomyces sp. NBC_00841]|uniref:IS3 family transposase n=1 Tax=Streptomyces sp. NBC_00841 TaxID=2975847 RepID=UPI00224CCBDB|nr:IS3 family transposase [Streptomyces sp. NBC_00841]MCX4530104.1 IS3 family transposase [Streptomyces sp. NBC_01669]WSA04688.1 IS3 family transposase [Streptomyces sp. NBC_00841]